MSRGFRIIVLLLYLPVLNKNNIYVGRVCLKCMGAFIMRKHQYFVNQSLLLSLFDWQLNVKLIGESTHLPSLTELLVCVCFKYFHIIVYKLNIVWLIEPW